ncbi:DNA repair protein for alkylated DNA [Neoasaia chiangmaiensis NBRC 101099]|nr:DNA repair protein for alkylated DNA [Neoasaia chiangmaiensis NBRC 101099]GEN15941.1 alpha-ketoglutarate-dependent dioxygenase AlkB [Neoasaia chiangmaiensis]
MLASRFKGEAGNDGWFGAGSNMMSDLFDRLRQPVALADGALFLPGAALPAADRLWAAVQDVMRSAPLRRLSTPGGRALSAEMSNCGIWGWHSDRQGYRYVSADPMTGGPWPSIPEVMRALAADMACRAGYENFEPQLCLINRYVPGARMGLHQDRDEQAMAAPIVSVSLGLPARFLFGGLTRDAPRQTVVLQHGDVVVWGGPSRLAFHGVSPIRPGHHALTGGYRYNLTFRRVT